MFQHGLLYVIFFGKFKFIRYSAVSCFYSVNIKSLKSHSPFLKHGLHFVLY